jgi:hypothetical protein
MKSRSSNPDFVEMSRCKMAMEPSLRPISSVTMAGSISIGSGTLPGGVPPGPSSGRVAMKSPRSMTVASASPISGSDLPKASNTPARVAGEPSAGATSTNSLPPASAMGRGVVSCHSESPRGFMGSVIIC